MLDLRSGRQIQPQLFQRDETGKADCDESDAVMAGGWVIFQASYFAMPKQ
jgi:hypothetical protein